MEFYHSLTHQGVRDLTPWTNQWIKLSIVVWSCITIFACTVWSQIELLLFGFQNKRAAIKIILPICCLSLVTWRLIASSGWRFQRPNLICQYTFRVITCFRTPGVGIGATEYWACTQLRKLEQSFLDIEIDWLCQGELLLLVSYLLYINILLKQNKDTRSWIYKVVRCEQYSLKFNNSAS